MPGSDDVIRRSWSALVTAGSIAAVALTVQTALNLSRLPRPHGGLEHEGPASKSPPDSVTVLVPARNEVSTIADCALSILAQPDVENLLILDDGSTDGTSELVGQLAASDPRVRLADPGPRPEPPTGWLGKPWACHRLSELSHGSVLVFVDADVVLEPAAIARAVSVLRDGGFDLVSPYPRELADGPLARLVQPLLQWSWLTLVPGAVSDSRQFPSMAVANGQFLVIDAGAYRRIGGHTAVAGEVIEDVALARALRRDGGRTVAIDGSGLATCRMYASDRDLIDGYTKSLWAAFGPMPRPLLVLGLLSAIYIVPPAAIVLGPTRQARLIGLLGYGAAITGRLLVARRTRQRLFPDVLGQPLTITALAALTLTSVIRKRRGTLLWKGRPV
ncbi:MAG: glycosyltransferase family 2 protein [Actinomycetes bacterium]